MKTSCWRGLGKLQGVFEDVFIYFLFKSLNPSSVVAYHFHVFTFSEVHYVLERQKKIKGGGDSVQSEVKRKKLKGGAQFCSVYKTSKGVGIKMATCERFMFMNRI